MIFLMILVYALFAAYEFRYMRMRGRKRKTYIKVFGLMAASFGYSLLDYLARMPSPNQAIEAVFRPLSQWLRNF